MSDHDQERIQGELKERLLPDNHHPTNSGRNGDILEQIDHSEGHSKKMPTN